MTKSNLKPAAAKSCSKRPHSQWLKTIRTMKMKIAYLVNNFGNRIIMTCYLALAPQTITSILIRIKNEKTIHSSASKTQTKRDKTSRAFCRPSQMSKLLQMSPFQAMIHLTQTRTSVLKSSLLSRLLPWLQNHHISNKSSLHSFPIGSTKPT